MKRSILLATLIAGYISANQNLPLNGRSYFGPRPQGTNSVTNLVGVKEYIFVPDRCENWSMFTLTLAGTKAFTTHRIADYFFGTNTIRFTGSMITNRAPNDILADYFGLSTTFESIVLVEPSWHSVIATPQWYIGLDGICSGLYLNIYAPIVWVQSHLKLKENIISTGSLTPYPAQYMSAPAIPAPLESVTAAFARTTPFGDVEEPLKFGTIAGPQKLTQLADVHAIFGWNFLLQDNGHVGINLHMVIPTGNRSKAIYLLEPVAGNGHHWEVGLGLTGHIRLWEKDEEQELGLYVDATFSHLCKSRQRRSFDLKFNGFGSRYTLLKEFDSIGAYTRSSVPMINKTTLACDVWQDLQIDFLIMFGYQYCDFGFDFGYNGWFKTREKIHLREGIASQRYGLKGIQNVTFPNGSSNQATERTATLHGVEFVNQALVMDNPSPVFISTGDIDLHSAAGHRALTHKLFAHVNHAWHDTCWSAEPFIGIGGSVEFEGQGPRNSEPNKPTMSQAEFWIKGGFSY